ncbi:MAG: 50S ribosomal protein L24 [Candidatus Thermoplasmatota archaeon]|nr:50S ribosomal protein L24 [Candidatus Thermoplasmatota archaeon]
MNVRLNKDLRKKYGIRSFPVSTGDVVSIKKGPKKGEGGKVLDVDHTALIVLVDGITVSKADGKQKEYYVQPSMLEITRLDVSHRGRLEKLKAKAALRDIVVEEEPEPIEETKETPTQEGEAEASADSNEESDEKAASEEVAEENSEEVENDNKQD